MMHHAASRMNQRPRHSLHSSSREPRIRATAEMAAVLHGGASPRFPRALDSRLLGANCTTLRLAGSESHGQHGTAMERRHHRERVETNPPRRQVVSMNKAALSFFT